ncbi:hypothetical protein [Bacillus sp. FJAT-44742]|uniref:hypothetical protein n=1 Tax=Bacillus sp. FJAT-44742 TaxID=2014005 RepID=UPI000C23D1A7|nr:hypothetical protein [Bacillus sp. FJAT-44742]
MSPPLRIKSQLNKQLGDQLDEEIISLMSEAIEQEIHKFQVERGWAGYIRAYYNSHTHRVRVKVGPRDLEFTSNGELMSSGVFVISGQLRV